MRACLQSWHLAPVFKRGGNPKAGGGALVRFRQEQGEHEKTWGTA